MNKKEFEKAMSEIDDSYIEEAACFENQKSKRSFARFVKRHYGICIAACFCICILGIYAIFGRDYANIKSVESPIENDGEYSYSSDGFYENGITKGTSLSGDQSELQSETQAAGAEDIESGMPQSTDLNTDKIIYTATMFGETTDFDDTAEKIDRLIKENGAFLAAQKTNEYGEGYRYASFAIRVPAENFDILLKGIETVCHIKTSDISADNVSESYHDMESRLESAKNKLERLDELLLKAENMEDIITIENAINEAQWEVDYYSGALKNYDSQIRYSTINLDLEEVYKITEEPAPKTFGERIGESFRNGWQSVCDFFEGFVVWLAYSWFWIVAAAVVIIAVVFTVRRRKKK